MNKVLIIVDMQHFFLKNMKPKNKKALIQNQLSVIQYCVQKKIPIIELEYDCPGVSTRKTIPELHREYTPHHTIVKKDNGGFTNTVLNNILKELSVREIILIGINANGCVQDTAIGGINRGYKIITAVGAIANVWRDDLELSKNNLLWYKNKTKLLSSSTKLIDYL